MGTVHNMEEYRSRKEGEKLREEAEELLALLDSFMFAEDDPLVISVEDSDGVIREYTLDELYDLSDSSD